MNRDDKRNFINVLRGIAIFLMLWGHSIQYCCGDQFDFFENTMFKVIYSFHMPFFMLISGYLFRFSEQKREMLDLIEYKAKNLLYPILMCSLLNLVLTKGVVSVLGGDIKLVLGAVPITGLWFLWSVLACSVALSFAIKLSNNHLIQVLLGVVGIIIVVLFPNWDKNLYMYPYFVIGYLYARNEEKLQKIRNGLGVISAAVFCVMLFFFRKEHYIYTSGFLGAETIRESLYIDLFRWGIGLFGSIAVVWTCRLIYGFVKGKRLIVTVGNLGRDSLAAYALSVSLLSFWLPLVANRALNILCWIDWNRYIWLYNLVVTPIVAIAYSIIILLIIRGLKKVNAYRLIFGSGR